MLSPVIPTLFFSYFLGNFAAVRLYLGGFSLGAMVGNLTCLSIMEGSLTAADTLMPRAFGARRYEELGRLAVRAALVGGFLLSIPVIPLCGFSGWILRTLGQDEEASALAQSWIRMYFIGAPANLVFRVLMRFLLSQNKPWPLVIASLVPALFLQPFLLEYFVPLMGVEGSAAAIAITQWVTLLILVVIIWIKPVHKQETWPGLSWQFLKESCALDETLRFLRLSVGGILSMNEWWYFEIMVCWTHESRGCIVCALSKQCLFFLTSKCFIAGSFGVESLDAHTIAYNLSE